ncbi:hypothetical protein IDAT_03560 [Pseudidiomarina atlantica]|uniref:SGNH hydrolase-type esterase domain-containing protein n=1 Tax=Pseudidiomarina atlantica TaxID=1517416 RepID=A0A094L452_9GAMM|nr:SGNH/GDSL hydrolase family protein [Pseudidiomarina atlantica]KFZ29438.1 hypothetical protein IDAT_03560 [Pseudidiomarina atlantica]
MVGKLLAAWLCALALIAPAQADEEPKRVLFVGNSFSFYSNGIHNHFANLLRAEGAWQAGENRVRLLTLSGGHIHETGRLLNSYLSSGDDDWHAVVLQGHSNEPIDEKKSARFEKAMELMIKALRERDIQPLLLMTWGYQNEPSMSRKLQAAYERVGKRHDALVVPVGVAFAAAAEQHPDIHLFVKDVRGATNEQLLYRRDIKHPSMAGTYLAACVMYASLYHRSPEGNLFTADLDADTARTLQRLSWQVVADYFALTTTEQE